MRSGHRSARHQKDIFNMKLNETRPYYESSGELEEQFFSIQDQGMIFDILRNKMYSNPILAICREISCNARDAHREVGTPEIPIHIHLPSALEPYYKVRDFGPGISPDRMSNIFIKYTASTKRNDNIQTGGFGLGAKTPFSYSDSFSIITNYNGTQYIYNCAIDSTKVGKLVLASESLTDEPNGTEIKIPVLAKNFNEFATWTEQACRHWKVRPIIKGGKLEWKESKSVLDGDKWSIVLATDYNRDAKMIIDGIEYPLDIEVLRKYADSKLIDAANGRFVMHFDVGELSLSASREQIYLDEKTQKVIRERLVSIQKDIEKKIHDKVNSYSNLWEANTYYRHSLKNAFVSLKFLGPVTWHGIVINDTYVSTNCPTFWFTKGKYSRKYGTDHNKLSRQNTGYLSFEDKSELYINDLPIKEPTPRHIKKAFEDNPDLKNVFVVCPNDKVTVAQLETSINIDKMAPKLLSTITKATGRTGNSYANRLILFKFDSSSICFRQTSQASMEEDLNDKVICFLVKDLNNNDRYLTLKNKKRLSLDLMREINNKFPKISFYGVDINTPQDRIDEEFSDFQNIEEFIQENLIDNQKIDYVELTYANSSRHYDDKYANSLPKVKPLIQNSDSVYIKKAGLHARFQDISDEKLWLLRIYESLHGSITQETIDQFIKTHPELDVLSIDNEFTNKYPLLAHVSTYYVGDIAKYIAQYVNLIDKE
jgi:hypothetical protein